MFREQVPIPATTGAPEDLGHGLVRLLEGDFFKRLSRCFILNTLQKQIHIELVQVIRFKIVRKTFVSFNSEFSIEKISFVPLMCSNFDLGNTS